MDTVANICGKKVVTHLYVLSSIACYMVNDTTNSLRCRRENKYQINRSRSHRACVWHILYIRKLHTRHSYTCRWWIPLFLKNDVLDSIKYYQNFKSDETTQTSKFNHVETHNLIAIITSSHNDVFAVSHAPLKICWCLRSSLGRCEFEQRSDRYI